MKSQDYITKTGTLKAAKANMSILDVGKLSARRGVDVGKVQIDKTKITTPKLVSNEITKTNGEVYMTKKEADASFVKPADLPLQYNWQPAQEQKIQFSLLEPYTVPSNGWFVKNADNYTENDTWYISINDRPMFNSDDNGEIFASILVQRGDTITSSSQMERTAYFMPCLSELQDWREESLKADYDIWKNAVLSDGSVVNQYLGSASDNSTSRWNGDYRSTFESSLHSIKLDEAFDSDNQHLFYIQTENLINGRDMLYGTALASFNGDLSSLTNGRYMFGSCFNLESFNSDLSSLSNGTEMFCYCTNLESFNSDLSSLTNGSHMFYKSALSSFSGDLPSLTDGSYMFRYCSNLESFNGDLSSLTNSQNMFSDCYNLESFYSDLSSLTNVNNMFRNCSNLKSFNGDLSSLTNGSHMFYQTKLASFTSDLSSLTNGQYMFADTAIKEWNINLPSLTDGVCMFAYNTKLASFDSDLSSLINGNEMFYYSNLSSFSGDLSSLTDGTNMFYNSALSSFSGDLSNLTIAYGMFQNCSNLTTFNGDLSNLSNGACMFVYSTNLASFDSDLSNLTNGDWMFCDTALTTFDSDLSKLTNGVGMLNNCSSLTEFNSDLSSLNDGAHMFQSTALTKFNSDLSSLTDGLWMFIGCKLDSDSVRRILIGQDADGNDIIGEKSGKLICIPTYESYDSRWLGLGISEDSIDTFKEITGTTETIPVISDGTEQEELARVDYKGWRIEVNART